MATGPISSDIGLGGEVGGGGKVGGVLTGLTEGDLTTGTMTGGVALLPYAVEQEQQGQA